MGGTVMWRRDSMARRLGWSSLIGILLCFATVSGSLATTASGAALLASSAALPDVTAVPASTAILPTTDSEDFRHLQLRNALERIRARNAYLQTTNTDVSQWKLGGTPAFHGLSLSRQPPGTIVSLLSPVYPCPWTLRRSNYVSEVPFDGGKWTCGLAELQHRRTPCVVYSFGSNNDDFFERDVKVASPDCEVHIFDPTSGTPPVDWQRRYHFHPFGLCVGSATHFGSFPCRNIRQIMIDLNHTYVDLLKADVEGMEWPL